MCYFAGEVLPERIATVFYRTWGIRVVNIVGSSESGTMMVWDSRYDAGADVNSYRPFTFTDVKIVDENNIEVGSNATGMIVVSTDAVMKGYHKNDEATRRVLATANGKRWYSTGDLGRKTAEGRIAFVGRSKRIIKRGANLVYPEEIESYLLTCEGVSAVAVLSEHHDVLGEKIAAYVQPTKGTGLTRNDVFNYCKGRLSSYKIPDNIVIVECVPHDIGKIHYKHIRPGRGAVS
jgi:fatty-acyl-CoA synthase